jgi:hypothetical protein
VSTDAALLNARRHGFAECEEAAPFAALFVETLHQQTIFVIEHRGEAPAAHIVVGASINFVADGGVVGRNRFGDGRRRFADAEKPADHFLPAPDFGERAKSAAVKIDLERLFGCAGFGAFHGFKTSMGRGSG